MSLKYRLLKNGPIPQELLDKAGDKILATILWNRGVRSIEQAEIILNTDAYSPHSPDEIPGMGNAVSMIAQYIQQGSRIAVYGDYDVDGVTSTALMVRTLKSAGADVVYHVPNRFTEGYGLNCNVVHRLANDGCKLIVTCDCGISSHKEINLAKELGLAVIVTDHHNIPDTMVPADVIVNPKFLPADHPFYWIPGVGVAYLLARALQDDLGFRMDYDPLQLVALGVVSDVVPLSGENRYWIRRGLDVINSENVLPGIEALLKVAKVDYVDENVIGFQLGPRLNAPGRLTSADICVELLVTENRDRAYYLAVNIDTQNKQRKQLVDTVLEDFKGIKPEKCIVEYNSQWHEGVIGIAAGRLCEIYGIPTVLLTLKDDGVTVIGSARSIEGVDIYSRLTSVSHLLKQYGGHSRAAGLSTDLDRLQDLITALRDELAVTGDESQSGFIADMELPVSSVDIGVYERLRRIAPYGEGFTSPVFCSRGVEVVDCIPIGDGKHTRLCLRDGESTLQAVWWNCEFTPMEQTIEVAYTIGVNRYNGQSTVQLEILGLWTEEKPFTGVLTIEDRRYTPGTNFSISPEPGIGIFKEGKQAKEGEFTRYGVRPCQTLVLTSIPPNLKILKHLIKVSGCSRVVLAYPNNLSNPPLLNRLMGVLKGMANRDNPITVRELASACEETEAGILAGLALLYESDMLQMTTEGEGIRVKLLQGKGISGDSYHYRRIKAAEEESKAFRKLMQCINLDNLHELLQLKI